jgi:hypothetical protein
MTALSPRSSAPSRSLPYRELEVLSGRFLWGLILLVLFLSILRGVNFPSLWGVSHYCFDYSVHFVVRGLIGSIFGALLGDSWFHYRVIATAIFALWALGIVLCMLAIKIVSDSEKSNLVLVLALVFVGSPAFVFFHNSVGYFDHFGLPVIGALVLLSRRTSSHKLMMVACAVSLILFGLIHESLLIVWGPIMFWLLVYKLAGNEHITLRRLFAAGVLVAATSGAVLLTLAKFATITPEQSVSMYKAVAAKADFPPRKDAFDFLVGSLDRTREVMRKFWQRPSSYAILAKSILIALPSLLLFGVAATSAVARRCSSLSVKIVACVGAVSAPLVPYVLVFFGWDLHRWSCLSVTASFVLVLITVKNGTLRPRMESGLAALAFLVLCINLSSANFLHYSEQKLFPFKERIDYLAESVRGEHPFWVLPDQ